jgi:nitroreductase
MNILSALNWRYAAKDFDPTRKVSDTDLAIVLEAMRLTPTSFGMQPYHFYVVTNQDIKNQIQSHAWNQPQVGSSSHLLVFTARTDLMQLKEEFFTLLSGGDSEVRAKLQGYEGMVNSFIEGKSDPRDVLAWAAKQTYIAQGFALAALAELQIDSCPMEGFDPHAVGEILGLPENQKAVLLLPIGYRKEGDGPRTPEKVRFAPEALFTSKV